MKRDKPDLEEGHRLYKVVKIKIEGMKDESLYRNVIISLRKFKFIFMFIVRNSVIVKFIYVVIIMAIN